MIVLGIDPGLALTGYGVVEGNGAKLRAIEYGCIATPAEKPLEQRLLQIYEAMTDLLVSFKPAHVAVEQLFFNRNVTTAFTVGQARGVVLLACAQSEVSIAEYTPMQVKQGIAGYGGADKRQVQTMVRAILGLREIPKPDDAADALAIAVTHANRLPMASRLEERLKLR